MAANDSNTSLGAIIKGLITLAAVIALFAFAFIVIFNFVGDSLASAFSALSNLDVAIVVAMITGTVSIVTVVVGGIINNRISYMQKKEEYLRQHREAPYQKLIAIFYDLMLASKKGEDIPEAELLERMNAFNQELTLWGSPKAIQLWSEWRLSSVDGTPDATNTLFKMEKVLIQLRKDMGQKRGLKEGDLLKLSINDVDTALKKN